MHLLPVSSGALLVLRAVATLAAIVGDAMMDVSGNTPADGFGSAGLNRQRRFELILADLSCVGLLVLKRQRGGLHYSPCL